MHRLVVRPHSTYVMQSVTYWSPIQSRNDFVTCVICICFISSSLSSADLPHADTRKRRRHTLPSPLNLFVHSYGPCDSATLALAGMTPFHLNRSFTRCWAINDWLPLRKTEGKTPALLVLQYSGVQHYSNHSAGVSRALSGMFGDWHLPASFADFYSSSVAGSTLD